MKICVDYVFEYFNNYLNITEVEEKTVLHNEKLEKYCYTESFKFLLNHIIDIT
jgi:hypothetical protein